MWQSIVLGSGVLVLLAAVSMVAVEAFDRRDRRRVERLVTPEAFWHAYLTQPRTSVDHRIGQLVVRRARVMAACKHCFAPFSGPLAPALRPLGHGPSPMNPDFCRRCYAHLPIGGAEVEITVLFADLRGSVAVAEQLPPVEFSALLNRFYASAVPVLVGHDALVDKLVGDQVMALFVPAFAGEDHARRAVEAGAEVLRSAPTDTDVGIGVHTGPAFVGVVGLPDGVTDFTAVGDTVNIAARLAAEANPGELLYTDRTSACLPGSPLEDRSPGRMNVRGRQGAVGVHSIVEAPHPRRWTSRQGRRPRDHAASVGWDSLTPTERDVAHLVAEGLTNRHIAARLMMSPYTVDTHLRHVFGKLRVRSRTSVAAEVVRRSPEDAACP